MNPPPDSPHHRGPHTRRSESPRSLSEPELLTLLRAGKAKVEEILRRKPHPGFPQQGRAAYEVIKEMKGAVAANHTTAIRGDELAAAINRLPLLEARARMRTAREICHRVPLRSAELAEGAAQCIDNVRHSLRPGSGEVITLCYDQAEALLFSAQILLRDFDKNNLKLPTAPATQFLHVRALLFRVAELMDNELSTPRPKQPERLAKISQTLREYSDPKRIQRPPHFHATAKADTVKQNIGLLFEKNFAKYHALQHAVMACRSLPGAGDILAASFFGTTSLLGTLGHLLAADQLGALLQGAGHVLTVNYPYDQANGFVRASWDIVFKITDSDNPLKLDKRIYFAQVKERSIRTVSPLRQDPRIDQRFTQRLIGTRSSADECIRQGIHGPIGIIGIELFQDEQSKPTYTCEQRANADLHLILRVPLIGKSAPHPLDLDALQSGLHFWGANAFANFAVLKALCNQ